ncbi:hypothetical protein CAL29_06270 [Bordetella genomosp. 10]|uniref:Uncharacterized protein n=1 Tax=Bordetella genomosp. 10 TaxID=1416804 RepID=A0A261SKN1_9BORD|nr:hypothetical protein CAL29_06270 [Bordetella genomosp. 10]
MRCDQVHTGDASEMRAGSRAYLQAQPPALCTDFSLRASPPQWPDEPGAFPIVALLSFHAKKAPTPRG